MQVRAVLFAAASTADVAALRPARPAVLLSFLPTSSHPALLLPAHPHPYGMAFTQAPTLASIHASASSCPRALLAAPRAAADADGAALLAAPPLLAVNGVYCAVTVLQIPGDVLYQNPRSLAFFGDLTGQDAKGRNLGILLLQALLQCREQQGGGGGGGGGAAAADGFSGGGNRSSVCQGQAGSDGSAAAAAAYAPQLQPQQHQRGTPPAAVAADGPRVVGGAAAVASQRANWADGADGARAPAVTGRLRDLIDTLRAGEEFEIVVQVPEPMNDLAAVLEAAAGGSCYDSCGGAAARRAAGECTSAQGG